MRDHGTYQQSNVYPPNASAAIARTPAESPRADVIRDLRLVGTQRIYAFFTVTIPTLGAVAAAWLVLTTGVSAIDLILFFTFYFVTLMGITVGFHRLFAHRSFKTSPAVTAAFAVLGSWAAQGPILHWVSNHRRHHKWSDRSGDPHSPNLYGPGVWNRLRGCWHAHIGSMFAREVTSYAVYAPTSCEIKR